MQRHPLTLLAGLFVVLACGSTPQHSDDGPGITREQKDALGDASALLGCASLHATEGQTASAEPYTASGCDGFYCDWRLSESAVSGDSTCGETGLLVCDQQCDSSAHCSTTCYPEAVGNLRIDGNLFVPLSCRSGDDENQDYYGVDLDDGTTTLRFAQQADLTQAVVMSADPNGAPVTFVDCERFELSRTPLPGDIAFSANGDVFGTATLQCSGGGHTISGTISFGCVYPQIAANAGQGCDAAYSTSS